MVQLAIEPALHDSLNLGKVTHHCTLIERRGAYFDLHEPVVSVQVPARAVVVEQPMSIAELDALRDRIGGMRLRRND